MMVKTHRNTAILAVGVLLNVSGMNIAMVTFGTCSRVT